ncbi:hypothetical protein ACIRRH_42515 [Kitasatospora sp. NPDC101235]|uniref:hypothetical protein n=1 Tax=Kitasatospora sp. NPDC101235 TaxID=3364101 RepID=UPI003805D685
MPINDAVPAPPPPGTLPPCPSCALTDQVRSVPAVHLSERRNVTVRASGRDGRTETREEVSALGRALAPPPPTTSTTIRTLTALGFVTLIGAVFTFIQGAMARDAPVHQKPDLSPPDWVTKHPGFPNDFPTDLLPGGLAEAAPASPAPAAPLADARAPATARWTCPRHSVRRAWRWRSKARTAWSAGPTASRSHPTTTPRPARAPPSTSDPRAAPPYR